MTAEHATQNQRPVERRGREQLFSPERVRGRFDELVGTYGFSSQPSLYESDLVINGFKILSHAWGVTEQGPDDDYVGSVSVSTIFGLLKTGEICSVTLVHHETTPRTPEGPKKIHEHDIHLTIGERSGEKNDFSLKERKNIAKAIGLT